MPRPPREVTEWGEAYKQGATLYDQQKRGPERWIYVGGGSLICPAWQNGFDHAGAPYEPVGFRNGVHGELEFKGHVDVSGATSGNIAFTLPTEFRPDKDVTWVTHIWNGTTFALAHVAITAATGAVRIYF